jgi:tetratricopeptide (TPR) repeat protein
MSKVCLTLFLVCFTLLSKAQFGDDEQVPQDNPLNNAAINISVPHNSMSEGDAFFEEAERNERQGELNDALTSFGKAAFEYNNEKLTNRYAASLLRMGNVHLRLNNYLEAEQVVLNAALRAYSKNSNTTGQMASYGMLGRIYLAANKLTQSMWFYTQQGILAKQLSNNGAHIESVIGIANVKIRKREFKMATRDLKSAELLARSYKISKYNPQIKTAKALILEKQGKI